MSNQPTEKNEAWTWWCDWSRGVFSAIASDVSSAGPACNWDSDNALTYAVAPITSATTPTLADLAAAMKERTGIEIPMPEEEPERWWRWGKDDGWGWELGEGAIAGDDWCRVWATTATRNAKRDELMAAQKAAGKDGEG